MTNLFNASVAVKRILKNRNISIVGNKTVFGNLESGIQGQLDNLLVNGVTPFTKYSDFISTLCKNPIAGNRTKSAQEAALARGCTTLTGNDGMHQAIRVAKKMESLAGFGPIKYTLRVEKHFQDNFGLNGLYAIREIQTVLKPVYTELVETAKNMEKAAKSAGMVKVHCLDNSELQINTMDVLTHGKAGLKKANEIELAYAERNSIE